MRCCSRSIAQSPFGPNRINKFNEEIRWDRWAVGRMGAVVSLSFPSTWCSVRFKLAQTSPGKPDMLGAEGRVFVRHAADPCGHGWSGAE